MNEKMREFGISADKSNFHVINLVAEWEDSEREVFLNGIPIHSSWSEFDDQPWLNPMAEIFHEVTTDASIEVLIDSHEPIVVVEQLAKQIGNLSSARTGLLSWSVQIEESVDLAIGFSDLIGAKLNRFWDGVRNLPYSDVDIIMGLANAVGYGVALKGDLKMLMAIIGKWRLEGC